MEQTISCKQIGKCLTETKPAEQTNKKYFRAKLHIV